jgi:hypothetical protein
MGISAENERRRSTRNRVLKTGRILIDRKSVISCIVRNVGQDGVRLEVPSVLGIPDTFVLEVGGGERRNARVIWRKEHALGIEYLAA